MACYNCVFLTTPTKFSFSELTLRYLLTWIINSVYQNASRTSCKSQTSIFRFQTVEVLGSSTLWLPSSFACCHTYVFMLDVMVVIKTGTCMEICFMGLAVHVLWFSAMCGSCLPAQGCSWSQRYALGAENVEHMQEKNNGNTFIAAVLAADLTPMRKVMSRSGMGLYFLKR